jgi:hypothetical protein
MVSNNIVFQSGHFGILDSRITSRYMFQENVQFGKLAFRQLTSRKGIFGKMIFRKWSDKSSKYRLGATVNMIA